MENANQATLDSIEIVIDHQSASAAMKQPNVRLFIRRVYIIVCMQLAFTCGMALAFIKIPTVNSFIIRHIDVIMLTSLGLFLCISLSFFLEYCMKPFHLTLRAILFGTIGLLMSVIVVIYHKEGFQKIVLQAAVITLTVFISFTLFTFQTKIDFTPLFGVLFMCTIGLLTWSILIMIMGWHAHFLLSLFGAILFGLWILFDTSMIIERARYLETGEIPSWRESLIYATNLYLDIMQLFLQILELLRCGGCT